MVQCWIHVVPFGAAVFLGSKYMKFAPISTNNTERRIYVSLSDDKRMFNSLFPFQFDLASSCVCVFGSGIGSKIKLKVNVG